MHFKVQRGILPRMSVPVNFKGLQYMAEYVVNEAFEDDVVSKYRSAVMVRVNDYLTIIHQAGNHAADLVGMLPYAKEEGGFDGAFIGAYILRETEKALRELLEEDDEMRQMIADYYATTETEDAAMRREAGRFDRDHHGDKNEEFRKSAEGFIDQVASDGAISDSAAGGSVADQASILAGAIAAKPTKIEVQVYKDGEEERVPAIVPPAPSDSDVTEMPAKENVSELLPSPTELPIAPLPVDTDVAEASLPPAPVNAVLTEASLPSVPADYLVQADDDDEVYPVDAALKLFGERPERIKIEAPNYSEKTPNEAFRAAVSWMVDHIIMVASGSKTRGKYPRIAPLMMADIPAEYAAPLVEMEQVTRNIRHHASKLRMSGEDTTGGEFRRLMDNIDPTDPDSMLDALRSMTDRLRGRDPHRPNYADSAQEEGGGWQESEGEDWK